ncbi:MAG: TonB-dependent receptor [Bacteroidales bacterium]
MPRKIIYFLLFLALSCLTMAGTKGRIKGKVVDASTGEPLIGANVTIIGASLGAATDVEGEYVILNIEAGVYDLKVSYLGYQTQTLKGIRVNADLTSYQDFSLSSEDISTATVEIIAKKPLIKKDATNAVRMATSEDIEALPVRGVNNVIALQAGVVRTNGAITIRGGRADEVGYYLEGVSINNPMNGGRAVTISQDAVEEVQVQTGGYTAEFGNANAGIIRTQLKSGTSEFKASFEHITDNVTFKSSDDMFDGEKRLGAYWYGYDETSFSLSGPIWGNKIKFFGNVNYQFRRDADPHAFPEVNIGMIGEKTPAEGGTGDSVNLGINAGPQRGGRDQQYTYTGTLTFDFNPILVRVTGTYTDRDADVMNNPIAGLENNRRSIDYMTNGSFNVKVTHVLSPTMYYELSGGYFESTWTREDQYLKDNYWAYGDSVANADAGVVFHRSDMDKTVASRHGRYATPYNKSIMGFTFVGPGSVVASHGKNERSNITFKGTFNVALGKIHSIRLGAEYTQYTMRSWAIGGQTALAGILDTQIGLDENAGLTEEQIKRNILINRGINNYGYDVLGNEYDGDGFMAPHKPIFASAFIQDKIEYEDIILNLGLRYDYIDVDNRQLIDPTRPETGVVKNTGELIDAGWTDSPTFSEVSPRIGISFPITDRTVFHAQFGKFVQQSRLRDIYQGYYRTSYEFRQSYAFLNPVGKDIKPTKTTQYELGFSQQLTDYISLDISGYYKDIKDQTIFMKQNVAADSPFSEYYTLTNGDYATTKGLEIVVRMRRNAGLAFNASISFQDARGTGSNPTSNAGIIGAPIDPDNIFVPKFVAPLDFSNSVTANFNVDYRFAEEEGTPGFLQNLGISLLGRFNNGHPYTRGRGVANLEGDQRGRIPVESLNASVTPSVFTIDLRVDKTFKLYDKLSANVYVRVINLFDTKVVENVFLRTGASDDNGYLTDPDLVANKVDQYGEIYSDVYRAINLDRYQEYRSATGNHLFGTPRQIMLGVRLEY